MHNIENLKQRLAEYISQFPAYECSDRTLAAALYAGWCWTTDGALYDPRIGLPDRDPQAAEVEAEPKLGLTFNFADVMAVDEDASVTLGALMNAISGFDIRDLDEDVYKPRLEKFQLPGGITWEAELPPTELPGLSESEYNEDTDADDDLVRDDVEPLTTEELVATLKAFHGQDILKRFDKRIVEWDGFKRGSVNYRGAMQKAIRLLCKTMLDTLETDEFAEGSLTTARTPEAARGTEQRIAFWTALKHIKEDGLLKLRRAVTENSFCPVWDHQSRWNIGERVGLVLDRCEQNDLDRSPRDEGAEGAQMDAELSNWLDIRAGADVSRMGKNVFAQMYYLGGEVLDQAQADDGTTYQAIAEPGERRPFSEENLYYWRSKDERIEREAKILHKLITFPRATVARWCGEENQLRMRYLEATKAAAPGPGKANVDSLCKTAASGNEDAARTLCDARILGWLKPWQTHGWTSVPLYGTAARDWLRTHTTPEWRAGKRVNLDKLRVVVAPQWEKLWLTAEQWQRVAAVIEKRLGSTWSPNVQMHGKPTTTCVPAGKRRVESAKLQLSYVYEHRFDEFDGAEKRVGKSASSCATPPMTTGQKLRQQWRAELAAPAEETMSTELIKGLLRAPIERTSVAGSIRQHLAGLKVIRLTDDKPTYRAEKAARQLPLALFSHFLHLVCRAAHQQAR